MACTVERFRVCCTQNQDYRDVWLSMQHEQTLPETPWTQNKIDFELRVFHCILRILLLLTKSRNPYIWFCYSIKKQAYSSRNHWQTSLSIMISVIKLPVGPEQLEGPCARSRAAGAWQRVGGTRTDTSYRIELDIY